MTLQQICFDPRGNHYVAITDAGTFAVPAHAGGWVQRQPWPYSVLCKPVGDVAQLARFLGMVSAPAPGQRMGGCQCKGRRS